MDRDLDYRINKLYIYFNGLVESELKNRILKSLESIQNIQDDEYKELAIKQVEKYIEDSDI